MLNWLSRIVNPLRKIIKSTEICRRTINMDSVEGIVCKETDIPENGMKEYEFHGKKVLLVKQKGTVYAIGTKCSHYEAPLVKGALGEGRVRCPWHGACFNLKTGDIEDHPGLDSLPCYGVSILENGDVKLRGKKSSLQSYFRTKNMTKELTKPDEIYAIVGAGAAGSSCAEALRQEGFTGRIIMFTYESYFPYERVKICKQLNIPISKIQLRNKEFYNTYNIEIFTNEVVNLVDTKNKVVSTESGKFFNYNKILIANGVKARFPTSIPGHELENITAIRTFDDANKIQNKILPESNVVVIGSSFIGMETASFCFEKCRNITIVGRNMLPFENIFGIKIGQAIKKFFESKGTKFMMNTELKRFEGIDNKLTAVIVEDSNGEHSIPADVCIIGLGVEFDTKMLSGSNITLSKQGAIETNEYLETNIPDVYAAGDTAYAPVYPYNTKASIGHWQLAQYHGRIAAYNMLGIPTVIKSVPFFYSNLAGKILRYAGYCSQFDDIIISGNVDELKFIAYFCSGDYVSAVCTLASDPVASQYAELIFNGKKLLRSEAKDEKWITKI